MKPEYPILYARASKFLAVPLITYFSTIYVIDAIQEPSVKVFPLGLSIFGITAALSSMSFSMARACDNADVAKYAGEKFLHSAILLIQCLLVLHIRDTFIETELVKNLSYAVITVRAIAAGIVILVVTAAFWTWFHGYTELNQILWENWRQRIENINTVAQDKGAVIPSEVKTDVLNKASSTEPASPSGQC